MNLVLGGALVLLAIFMGIGMFAMMRDIFSDPDDRLVAIGFGGMIVIALLAMFAIGVAVAFGGFDSSDQPMEGACYRAVARDSYIPMTTGKVTVIIPVSDVDLVEIRCP